VRARFAAIAPDFLAAAFSRLGEDLADFVSGGVAMFVCRACIAHRQFQTHLERDRYF
jgi:hypothetical protein